MLSGLLGLLSGTDWTVMLASGLLGRFWFSAFSYAAVVHNVTFSVARLTSPHLLMYGEKPDITNHQQFGVEGWIYRREDQRKDVGGNLTPVVSRV